MLRTLATLGGRAVAAASTGGALTTMTTTTTTTAAAAAAVASTSFSSSSSSSRRSFAAAAKETTGIVGLEVDPQARITLRAKLGRVMAALDEAGVPAAAQYRRSLAALCGERLAAVDSDATDAEVEDKLGFQLEALSKQCDEELALIPKMAAWKPWDVKAGHTVELRIEKPVE